MLQPPLKIKPLVRYSSSIATVYNKNLTAALTPYEQNVLLAFPLSYYPKKPALSFNKHPASIAYYSNSSTAADYDCENA